MKDDKVIEIKKFDLKDYKVIEIKKFDLKDNKVIELKKIRLYVVHKKNNFHFKLQ